ncbi:hypothetical protein [Candidatus Nitrospira bockiana]
MSRYGFVVLVLGGLASLGMPSLPSDAKEFDPNNPLNPPPPVYWCAERMPDRQITTSPEPGCRPLVEEEPPKANAKKREPRDPIKIQEIQNEASRFAAKYRAFLECCAARIDAYDDLEELEDEAVHILKSVQQKGIFNSAGFGIGSGADGLGGGAGQSPKLGTFARQWTLSEIVGTVARARDDLRRLKKRLEELAEAKDRLETLDYETAARERRRIQEDEEAIAREFKAKQPPPSARTGMEIQNTTLPTRIGGDIESTTLGSSFGADINRTVSPYSDVREDLRPRRGEQIQDTNLPTRFGPALGGGNTPESNLPASTGFEIGTEKGPTGPSSNPVRVGPHIGDSTLNNP